MTDVTKLREIATLIEGKARELSTCVHALTDHVEVGHEADVEFALEMIRDRESAVVFWVDELKKAVRE